MKDQTQENSGSGFAFKVLSGALNGIEFTLGKQDYFVCVGDAGEQQKNLSFADHTLYLPSTDSSNNFIVNLSAEPDENKFEITICYPSHQETRLLEFNSVCEVEGVHFAIRPENVQWNEQVKKGVLNSSVLVGGPSVPSSLPDSPPEKSKNCKSILPAIVLLLILGAGTLISWNYFHSRPTFPTLANTQFQQLVGERAGYFLEVGSDDINYLFASTAQQADWAHQAIVRKKLTETWRVVTPQTEEARMAALLDRKNIAFFAIRFLDPGEPTLLLSSTRNKTDEASLSQVKQMMASALPYARNVNILLYSDEDVLDKAQQGLKALGFEYQTIKSDSGVTLSSWMPSVDVHLSEFSRYVSQFYRTWGQRYIHFSADMRDDFLKNKSYKYGDDGFITMSNSHWLFNKKQD